MGHSDQVLGNACKLSKNCWTNILTKNPGLSTSQDFWENFDHMSAYSEMCKNLAYSVSTQKNPGLM